MQTKFLTTDSHLLDVNSVFIDASANTEDRKVKLSVKRMQMTISAVATKEIQRCAISKKEVSINIYVAVKRGSPDVEARNMAK